MFNLIEQIPNAVGTEQVAGQEYVRDASGNWYYRVPNSDKYIQTTGTPRLLGGTWNPPSGELQISDDGKTASVPQTNNTNQGTENTQTTTNTNTDTQSNSTSESTTQEQSQQEFLLEEYLNQTGLDDGQKAIVRQIFQLSSQYDKETADRAIAAMEAAKEYSDPYFKAQLSLAVDSLNRSLSSADANLSEQEASLRRALQNLQQDVAAGKDYLSFQQTQELAALQRNYEQQLESTQNALAATGFTQSSRRSKEEQILNEVNSGLVESTNRSFTERQNQLTNQLDRTQTNTAAEIERLRRLTEEGKIDVLRGAEASIGTSELQKLGLPTLGDQTGTPIAGELERQKLQDQLSFSNSFVF